jgi:hypothetical protein
MYLQRLCSLKFRIPSVKEVQKSCVYGLLKQKKEEKEKTKRYGPSIELGRG